MVDDIQLEPYFNSSINENNSVALLPDGLRGRTTSITGSGEHETLRIGRYTLFGVWVLGALCGFVLPVALLGVAITIAIATVSAEQDRAADHPEPA
ncbi:hypothetical protein EB74_09650 [Mycobacterium sp. SWH-M5]|nr:hypothetical protein EB74_09650 [Mycobacterium sp. SWH-M5]